ncbi:MAG: hypothetical protein ABIW33_08620 [Sphingomicrobium sp.]
MIALLMASAINLAGLQATITAPTGAFRTCLRQAVAKAETDKVSSAAIEPYLRSACTVQMGTLRGALVAFRMKNGMSSRAAASDANMTVDDYVSTPAENYKFMADLDAKNSGAEAAPAAKPGASEATAAAGASSQAAKP